MSPEESLAWPTLRVLAWKAYRMFAPVLGNSADMEDFWMIGVMAVIGRDKSRLARIVAMRRMIDYGRKMVGRHEQLNFVSLEGELAAPVMNREIAIDAQNWLRVGHFGLTSKDLERLRLYFWEGFTFRDMGPYSQHKLNRAIEKIRKGIRIEHERPQIRN